MSLKKNLSRNRNEKKKIFRIMKRKDPNYYLTDDGDKIFRTTAIFQHETVFNASIGHDEEIESELESLERFYSFLLLKFNKDEIEKAVIETITLESVPDNFDELLSESDSYYFLLNAPEFLNFFKNEQ